MSALLLSVMFLSYGIAWSDRVDPGLDKLFRDAKSICEVATNRELYAGRRIAIRATYAETPHGRELYDQDCGQIEISVTRAPKPNDERAAKKVFRQAFAQNRNARVLTVFSGTLTFAPVIVGCDLPSCFRYTLEKGDLVAAKRPDQAR